VLRIRPPVSGMHCCLATNTRRHFLHAFVECTRLVFLHESGITFQLGAAAVVAGRHSRGETVHDGLQVTSDGTRAERGLGLQPGARASNQVPCRDDLKCTAGRRRGERRIAGYGNRHVA
jgi:hypothetical protein